MFIETYILCIDREQLETALDRAMRRPDPYWQRCTLDLSTVTLYIDDGMTLGEAATRVHSTGGNFTLRMSYDEFSTKHSAWRTGQS